MFFLKIYPQGKARNILQQKNDYLCLSYQNVKLFKTTLKPCVYVWLIIWSTYFPLEEKSKVYFKISWQDAGSRNMRYPSSFANANSHNVGAHGLLTRKKKIWRKLKRDSFSNMQFTAAFCNFEILTSLWHLMSVGPVDIFLNGREVTVHMAMLLLEHLFIEREREKERG